MRDEITAAIARLYDLTDEPNSGPYRVADGYADAHNHAGGINPRRAIGALTEGHVERYDLGSRSRVTLATSQITVGAPYLQVIYATENPPAVQGTIVSFAWRLYGPEVLDLRPTEAFAEVVSRYGLDVRCGDRQERFMALETIEGVDLELHPVGADSRGRYTISAMMQRLPQGHTQVSWAFCIDDARYLSAVASARG